MGRSANIKPVEAVVRLFYSWRGGLAQLPASGQGTSFISPTLFQVLHLESASR
jgi:hypothetical protein